LSRGRALPGDQPQEPQHSFIFTTEDSAAVTVVPRLMALDADFKKIDISEKAFALNPEALRRLEADIAKCKTAFVVFDGFMTYVASAMDTYKAPEVGRFMYELFDIAKRTNAAIVLLRHLKKGGDSNPKYRGLGSIAFFGSIRSGLQVESEQDNGKPPGIATHHKHNLTGQAPAQRYGWVDGRFQWLGEAEPRVDKTPRTKLAEAQALIRELLGKGDAPAKEVHLAAETNGINEKMLERAKKGLAESYQNEELPGSPWYWRLREGMPL
jgi:DNA repair protein RadA/Sms